MIERDNYVQFEKLVNDDSVVHIFTKKPFNFGINNKDSFDNQYKKIEKILNYNFVTISRINQNHTNNVVSLKENNINDELVNVDGVITNLKGVALVTKVADCQSILLYDPVNKVIGNVHSGWRGTLNKILKNAITIMIDEYKCKVENIEVYICPSILKSCFEVDYDVVDLFKYSFDDINIEDDIYKGEFKDNKHKFYIDTVNINVKLLLKMGVLKKNIVVSNICTKCNNISYHSYRGSQDKYGRNIALICLK